MFRFDVSKVLFECESGWLLRFAALMSTGKRTRLRRNAERFRNWTSVRIVRTFLRRSEDLNSTLFEVNIVNMWGRECICMTHFGILRWIPGAQWKHRWLREALVFESLSLHRHHQHARGSCALGKDVFFFSEQLFSKSLRAWVVSCQLEKMVCIERWIVFPWSGLQRGLTLHDRFMFFSDPGW